MPDSNKSRARRKGAAQPATAENLPAVEPFTMTTARAVFVSYPHGDAPSELHPSGISAGFRTESPSPEVAKQFHPNAVIVGYVDGTVYDDGAATRELRKRDKLAEDAVEGDAEAVEVVKVSQKASGRSTRAKLTEEAAQEALADSASLQAAQEATDPVELAAVQADANAEAETVETEA